MSRQTKNEPTGGWWAEVLKALDTADMDISNGSYAAARYRLNRLAADIKAEAAVIDTTLTGAFHALKSYEHGNAATDLAHSVAESVAGLRSALGAPRG